MTDFNLLDLAAFFPDEDIEWRIGRSGRKDGKPWAMALAYVTNRAIMSRLDEVCGPENWKNEFLAWKTGGVLCGISIKISGEWVTKWDGAEDTDIEAVKGGLSSSMKRAAVQWGIGRYLYNLDETFVTCQIDRPATKQGWNYAKGKDDDGVFQFYWQTPKMPANMLPGNKAGTIYKAAQNQPNQA